jgi:hypothetical protein
MLSSCVSAVGDDDECAFPPWAAGNTDIVGARDSYPDADHDRPKLVCLRRGVYTWCPGDGGA